MSQENPASVSPLKLRVSFSHIFVGEGQDVRRDGERPQSNGGRSAVWEGEPAVVRGLHSQSHWRCVLQKTPPQQVHWHWKPSGGDFSMFSIISLCLFLSASVRDAFISTMLAKEPSGKCRRWLYDDIKEAHFMRFLLEVIIPSR